MRRIIQIDESEYNQLVDMANLNGMQIEEKALALYEDRGVAKVEVTIRTDNSCYSTRYFKCGSYVWYKDERFFISEKLRNGLGKFITELVQYKVNQDYEKPERLTADYERKLNFLKNVRYIIYAVAASGWAAFVTLLCMK